MGPKIVFEDEYLLVLDKPAGMVVNRAESVKGETLQDWVESNNRSKPDHQSIDSPDFVKRSGIVHRLDKETSGLLVVAKTPEVFSKMQEQFKLRMVKKKYIALVHGVIKDETGTIKAEVGRLPWNRERFGVLDEGEGKEAETEYKVTKRLRDAVSGKEVRKHPGKDFGYTLVELFPKTGRTHQIRVHLKSIGHPVVADEFYAGRKTAREDRKWCPRLFLHAKEIEFCHPLTHEWIKLVSNLPSDLQDALSLINIIDK